MKNEKFAAMEEQINKWIASKEKKEKELRDALEEAQAGLDAATVDSDKYMKAGDLKKYAEAETRKGFYNKRIDLLTNQLNRYLEEGFLSVEGHKSIIGEINHEQQSLLRGQRERLEDLVNEINIIVMETTAQIREGNSLISTINMNLRGVNFEDNPYIGTSNNEAGEAIAENYWYSLQFQPVPRHYRNARYSKFVAGVPFVN